MIPDDSTGYSWEQDALGSWRDALAEIKRRVEANEPLHPLHEELFKPQE